MTKEELLKNMTWGDYDIGRCSIYVPLFDKEMTFVFIQEHMPKPTITDKMTQSVNEILALKKSELPTIKEMLYEECLFAFQVSDYGCEAKEGETDLEAHLREFEISNKEDAYAKCHIEEIFVNQENDEFTGSYGQIVIDTASDNLIHIIVKNGKLIDWDDDGCYVGFFEKDEQYAKNARKKTLG